MLVKCPAKVNLGLWVGERQADGYHDLRTVFQTIAIHDRLRIEVGRAPGPASVELSCNIAELAGESNLATRAARAVIAALPRRATDGRRVRIHLNKEIPAGAGLGGGSSDAAGVLRALPRLLGQAISAARQRAMAAALGADVPFFLVGGRALGLGRGSRLRRLPDRPPAPLLVVFPGLHVSTADAYRVLDESRRLPLTTAGKQIKILGSSGRRVDGRGKRLENDFEPVVFSAYPELARLKAILTRAGASPALLSGSGSAMFGVFDSAAEARRAATEVRRRWPKWRTWVTRTTPRSGGSRL